MIELVDRLPSEEEESPNESDIRSKRAIEKQSNWKMLEEMNEVIRSMDRQAQEASKK